MELRFSPLFSGSSGNAIYVGCGDTHILVDAGLSGTKITNELAKIGLHPSQLSAIMVTHEHTDHTQGVGILSRKFHLPVYATEGTWDGMAAKIGNIDPRCRCFLTPEQDFYLDGLNILPFSTPHDANQPVGFRFEFCGAKFCIATDLGCIKKGWMNHVSGADAVLLESNYDPDMLKAGAYPYELKRRILSNRGHLCNEDSGAAALELVKNGARHIVLGHLSKENNFPELARRCCEDALMSGGVVPGEDVRIDVASRDGVTGIFGVKSEFE
ncbi:MAG: MBL fold metallo-hydrolase [Clostridia bacterium]|nr:MBL fold metallo-hydrolase [Clostridia bacterium]